MRKIINLCIILRRFLECTSVDEQEVQLKLLNLKPKHTT